MEPVRRVIAIIGGSGGLGQAVSLRLAQDAAVVVGYNQGRDRAEELVARISSAGGQAKAEQVNITDSASIQSFFHRARQSWNRLDAIVSVTGPPITLGPLLDVPEDKFRSVIEADVLGAFNVVKHGIPVLQSENRPNTSLLLFLTAAVGRTLEHDGLSYIPKKCVEGIIRQTAREVGASGIRINGLAPGVIDAGIVLTSFNVDQWGASTIESCLRQTPLQRKGKAEEVANTAAFLISSDAGFVTGQILSVDGGYNA